MQIGDIVEIDFMNIEGKIENGIFVIIYLESADIPNSLNFTALKVSSREYCYQVLIKKEYVPYLEHDSYINCNQMFRFHFKQVKNLLGSVSPYYLNKIIQQTGNYFKSIEDGLFISIGRDNIFSDLV